MAARTILHGARSLAAPALGLALALAGCAPSYVAWPRTPPPERPAAAAEPVPEPLVARALDRGIVVHPPFRDSRCGACHVKPRGGGILLAAADRLCAGCHADDVRRARPHKGGRSCLDCHARHVSASPGRLAGPGQRACRRCHDVRAPAMSRAHQGQPLGGARCERCHDPHGRGSSGALRAEVHRPAYRCSNCHAAPAEGQGIALIRSERETCGRCHPQADPTREAAFEHAPFGAGCSACHEPHAASRPHLLAADERTVCVGCHADVGARLAAGRAHAPAATGKCHLCHSPHGAEHRALLVAEPPELCTGCHVRRHEGNARAPSGDDGRCVYCHDPHGGGRRGAVVVRAER